MKSGGEESNLLPSLLPALLIFPLNAHPVPRLYGGNGTAPSGSAASAPLSAVTYDCPKSPVSLMMPDRAWVGSRRASVRPILILNPGLRRTVVART